MYLPFDFYLSSIAVIIELDGRQHWAQIRTWKSPELTQINDLYKMRQAYEQGLTVIRICQEDVWKDTYDWQTTLSSHLYLHEQPTRILLDNGKDIYKSIGYLLEDTSLNTVDFSDLDEDEADSDEVLSLD